MGRKLLIGYVVNGEETYMTPRAFIIDDDDSVIYESISLKGGCHSETRNEFSVIDLLRVARAFLEMQLGQDIDEPTEAPIYIHDAIELIEGWHDREQDKAKAMKTINRKG